MLLPTPTLQTARLRLRPFSDADTDGIYAIMSNPRVMRYWDTPAWSQRKQAELYIARRRTIEQDGVGVPLAITFAADDVLLGQCNLHNYQPGHRSAGLGYCLDNAFWGNGIAAEAVHALLNWGFATLDLNRVQAEVDTRNGASARLLETLGFTREGALRQNCIVNGEVSDSWVYGLLKQDWSPMP